ncbi:hypothetical protein BGZ96_011003 [Linnemannia gamsii]|uniref:Uncharacterized protein n=1 Tax=Linnemannia gamsii TaxID=64522 RepID=A0ABQ7KCV0_9FUNG|nr:hypothetical protein BGZ96_011003 [Linnemannia gamsii]
MPWPPLCKAKYRVFDFDIATVALAATEALAAIELDIKRWENVLTDLWQPHVFENNERSLVVFWVITRLQYLRALYPVMDANKYDYDIMVYFNNAVRIMNTKGPDCTAVVDFMSRKKENDQGDYTAYFDKWFENNSVFGIWLRVSASGDIPD